MALVEVAERECSLWLMGCRSKTSLSDSVADLSLFLHRTRHFLHSDAVAKFHQAACLESRVPVLENVSAMLPCCKKVKGAGMEDR